MRRETKRTKRINKAINAHYKSNNDCWWVSASVGNGGIIQLHKGGINNHIEPVWIAKFIFANEPSVKIIHNVNSSMIYTRESVKWYKR